MKSIKKTFLVLACSAFLTTGLTAGELGWDEDTNAKLARHKADARRHSATNGDNNRRGNNSNNNQGGECGSVNVGNVTNQRGAQSTREVTVIITGDIVNANNKCD